MAKIGAGQTGIGPSQSRGFVVNDQAGNERVRIGEITPPVAGSGNAVGDYGIKVTSSDGTTVIIDGTSDVFKIVASGTLNHTVGATTDQVDSVTLTALGSGYTNAPAHLSFIASNPTGANNYVGSWFRLLAGVISENNLISAIVVAGQVRVDLETDNRSGSPVTRYGKYNILQETAL